MCLCYDSQCHLVQEETGHMQKELFKAHAL